MPLIPIPEHSTQEEIGFNDVYTRAYAVPVGGTLASMNLERGDGLPETGLSAIHITSSRIEPLRDGTGRIAMVVAMKRQTGA